MPPVTYGDWLIRYLWTVGPIAQGGAPISWSEISAWQESTHRRLDRWEAETLHAMSEAYAVLAIKARQHDCKAPWKPIELSPEIVNDKIKNVFGAMRRKQHEQARRPLAQKIPRA